MAKLGIIYWSGTGNTEKMAELITKGASEAGAEVVCKSVSAASADELDGYDVVALGSPSMGAEVVEESEMQPFVEGAMAKLKTKKVALFGSYGWGDGEWMRTWSADMKAAGVNLLDDGLIVNETPDGGSADECVEYGRKVAAF
ncbi:flavodoxin [Synergistaceae bacterium OttesenSCG-928-I11]|nr:flavodoxin [Synergistaceae bacterium OttesenSCG-928-I11]